MVLLAGVTACCAVCFGEVTGNCTQTDAASRADCPGAIAFFDRVEIAVKNNDRQALASMVHYPVITTAHGKRTWIRSRATLLSHFDEVFDAGVRCTISNSTSKDVWGNWRGFTIDGGDIWFDGIIPTGEKPDIKAPNYWTKYPFAIIAVNNGSNEDHCKKQ